MKDKCISYNYSLLIKKDACECRNVSVKFPCTLLVYLYLLSGDLFTFSSFPFLFLFLCYPYLGTLSFHVGSCKKIYNDG
jgi:hypothetical protein